MTDLTTFAPHDPICPAPHASDVCMCPWIAKVRADERERVHVTSTGLSGRTDYAQVRSEVLADFRAKVEALPGMQYSFEPWVTRADVLALIDGRDNE